MKQLREIVFQGNKYRNFPHTEEGMLPKTRPEFSSQMDTWWNQREPLPDWFPTTADEIIQLVV